MTIRSHNPHVKPLGSGPKQILQNSGISIAGTKSINEANFLAQFTRTRAVDDLWWDNFGILPEQAVECHLEAESQREAIDSEEVMPKNESASRSGYDRLSHNDIRHIIQEALKEHEKDGLRRLIDDRCEKLVLALFERARKHALENVRTSIFEVIKQATRKNFFTGEADELLDNKI